MTSTWKDLFDRANAHGVTRERIVEELERMRSDG